MSTDGPHFDEDAILDATIASIRTTNERTREEPPRAGSYRNKDRKSTLQDALDAAWQESGLPPDTQFRVTAIWGVGKNPFTGYRVELTPDA